jgi:predicted SAM-dependent methyltransferase
MMIRQFIQRHTSNGLCSALGHLKRELIILRKHRQGVHRARKLVGQEHLRLNLGCGPKLKNGWLNVDLSRQADLTLDLREPLPLSESCCSIVYSEHFLEHLDYPEPAIPFLKECYRVLEPAGVFSAGVPDTEWPLVEYGHRINDNYFRIAKERPFPDWCQTEMEYINFHFRQSDQHRFAYDFKTLALALTEAGFQNVEKREFDPNLDSADRKLGTIYVRAVKPGTD